MTEQSHFSTPGHRPVDQADYLELAQVFIAQIAPSLREELRVALAIEVTEQLIGLRPRYGFGDLVTPLLRVNLAWLWPEIAEMFPYLLPNQGPVASSRSLGEEHTTASFQAELHKEEVQARNFKRWVLSERMATITASTLLGLQGFVASAHGEYQQWHTEVSAEIDRLRTDAEQPPVPRHLEWLAWLVTQRLDAHHSYFNSTTGPLAFDARLAAIIARARNTEVSKDTEIDLGPFLSFCSGAFGNDIVTCALDLVNSVKLTLVRVLQTPSKIPKHFNPYRPDEFGARDVCEECAQGGPHKPLPATKPPLAPFHYLCRCRDFRWAVKSRANRVPISCDRLRMGQVQLSIAEALVGLSSVGGLPVMDLLSCAQALKADRE